MNDIRNKITRIIEISVLLTIIVMVTGSFGSAVDWSPATQLTTHWATDRRSSITQTRDGTFWVVWVSDRYRAQFDLYYKTSSDNGSSWSDATRLTRYLSIDGMPSITQTRDGTLWVVWASLRTGDYELFYKTYTDELWWSLPIQLTTNPGEDDATPSISQDADGRIWVVWQRFAAGNYDIYYMTSSDNGLSWSNATRLTTHPYPDLNPSITHIWNGTSSVTLLVWASYRTGDQFDLYYMTSSDNGSSWSNATQLTEDPEFDHSPSVLQAVNGTVWVAWTSDRSGENDLYYKASQDFGLTWSSDTRLTEDPEPDESASLANAKDRKTWLTFDSNRTGNFEIFYRTLNATPNVHDIAITNIKAWGSRGVTVTWVPRGVPIYVNVTVENQGNFQETFNVTAYADRNVGDIHEVIGTQQNVSLANGTSTTLVFTWNTTDTPYGTYYISAEATVVPGECDTTDNIMLHGATIGGICVPYQQHEVNILTLLARPALAIFIMVTLGTVAIIFFKLLMSVKLPRPWRLFKAHPLKLESAKQPTI